MWVRIEISPGRSGTFMVKTIDWTTLCCHATKFPQSFSPLILANKDVFPYPKKLNIYYLSCFSWSIFIISKICKWNITRLWHVTSKSFWMWCYANIRLVEVLMWPFWPSSQQVPLVKLFPSNWCVYLSLLKGYSLKEGDKHAMNYARIAFCTKTSTNWCLHY